MNNILVRPLLFNSILSLLNFLPFSLGILQVQDVGAERDAITSLVRSLSLSPPPLFSRSRTRKADDTFGLWINTEITNQLRST